MDPTAEIRYLYRQVINDTDKITLEQKLPYFEHLDAWDDWAVSSEQALLYLNIPFPICILFLPFYIYWEVRASKLNKIFKQKEAELPKSYKDLQ